MPPDRSFSLADVRRLVARWAGGEAWQIDPAPDGVSTPVFRLSRGPEIRYLRLAEQPGECRVAEKHAHDLLRIQGVRVPQVVWFDPLAPEVNRSAMITTAIAGAPLDGHVPDGVARAIVADAGRDLARINAVPVRGYGWVVGVDASGGLVAAHRERAAWVAEYRAALEELPGDLVLDRVRLATLLDRWAALPGKTESSLAHGDLDTTHIYCQDSTYTGIIDFGEMRGTDRAYDLGHFLLHDGECVPFPLLPALRDGYLAASPGTSITRPDITVWAVAIGVRALARALRDPFSAYAGLLIRRLDALLSG